MLEVSEGFGKTFSLCEELPPRFDEKGGDDVSFQCCPEAFLSTLCIRCNQPLAFTNEGDRLFGAVCARSSKKKLNDEEGRSAVFLIGLKEDWWCRSFTQCRVI